ncbi:MAG: ATP-dependent protease LonB, partial [Clostridia bacterium]|nr:ATP-dependent protease LonB [Clostridia bacterium]
LTRKSSVRASIDNMLTLLTRQYGIDTSAYHLHINFPGGTPIDGPSAGTAILTAVYSAITMAPVSHRIAMTGEISIHGRVMPVGGVAAKIAAAKRAGIQTVYIPKDNFQESFQKEDIQIVPVCSISEIFSEVFGERAFPLAVSDAKIPAVGDLISAQTAD